MKTESHLPQRSSRLTLIVLAAACLAVSSVALPPTQAEAGSLVIPAWSFARGNGRIHVKPDEYADAGPVVGGGPKQPWGWSIEYDVDIPVTAKYTIGICYASTEARPVEVFFDDRNLTKCCTAVTFASTPGGKSDGLTSNSSGARWESVQLGMKPIALKTSKGIHRVMLTRRGPLPHLVALRLDTPEAFPDSWRPPKYKVRDIDSIPAAYRKAFGPPSDVDAAAMRKPVEPAPRIRNRGSLKIDAWTFDRGNARIYASPNQYANSGPLVGGGPPAPAEGVVEYDIDFPVSGKYTLQVRYAADEARAVEVLVDGKPMGKCCMGVTFGSPPFTHPVTFSGNSRNARWEGFCKRGKLVELSITKGKHTLKFARRGPLPHLATLRLDSPTSFPKGWKPSARKIRHIEKVPTNQRAAFLPPDAVNVAALRLAVQDTIERYGPRYPKGPRRLEQLSELEARRNANSTGSPRAVEDEQKIEQALKSLRQEAMLSHPLLKFDRLLFVKRATGGSHHVYGDQVVNAMGGNLCVLSPVTDSGKVAKLVGELDGGLFWRFDLSFDAKKVVFGYKKKGKPFRIYQIGIDPSTGVMVPGSLRQLTFGGKDEDEAIRSAIRGRGYAFHDMDPCYLPNGKIVFTSTRSMRTVFCHPSIVTTLYLMDADGKNMRCLSAGPLNEIAPCLMDDGRVIYTRWEYVDKGLGNGQSLWAVRPDGSGVDHVYKNNTVSPAGMVNSRSIPGSRLIVTIAAPHCGPSVGPVILVDARHSRRTTEAMNCITPEVGYPGMVGVSGKFGYYKDPYPFSEKFFLVSHAPGPRGRNKKYGIYALDAWGNRAKLHGDPETSCFEPMPLRPRRKPMQIAAVEKTDAKQKKTGTLFIQDVYEGMTGIERGRVKYVRVMGVLPFPWNQRGISLQIGMNVDVHRKKVYGVAKVHKDGSACFTAPAGENLLFQALDENFMLLQHMATFINLMPGENRSCIGCHEPRRNAPGMARIRPLAMDHPAQTLAPQPGDTGPRMVHYASDVQPVLNKHCIGCHSGAGPKARLDLTGAPTGFWNRSYENLIGNGLVDYRDCRYGRAGFEAVPPLTHGSHRSKLSAQIRKAPCKAKLTRAEFVRIVTWIDANIPYYGTYRGKRDIKYKNDPDFRLPPLAVGK